MTCMRWIGLAAAPCLNFNLTYHYHTQGLVYFYFLTSLGWSSWCLLWPIYLSRLWTSYGSHEPPHLKDEVCFKVENWAEYYQLPSHIMRYFYILYYLLDHSNNFLSYTAQSWRQIDYIITVLRRLWYKTGHVQLFKNAVQSITCFKWRNYCLINKY